MQTGLTGHSRLIRDNWVTHVLREWLVGVDHSTGRKSQIQTCQKCPPTKPTINELITSLRNVRICQYYCYGPEIRIQGRLCTYTHENNAQQSEYYTYTRAYMDNTKYLYRFRNPVKYWVVCRLPWQQNTRFSRVTGEQIRTRGCGTLFPQMGSFDTCLGPGLLPRPKYCRESFILKRVKKSLR
jgi:hypothetical protein